jgi:hypothetical protein
MISIVVPIWKRPTVTSLVLGSWPREGFRVVVVGSPGDDNRRRYEDPFDYYVEAPNARIGAKFNAGIKAAAQLGDPILLMDPCQVAAPHFWDAMTIFAQVGLSVGLTDTWMADGRRAIYWGGHSDGRAGGLVGPGRMAMAKDYEDLLYGDPTHPNTSFDPDIVLSGRGFGFCSLKTSGSTPRMVDFVPDLTMKTFQFLDIYHPLLKGIEGHLA